MRSPRPGGIWPTPAAPEHQSASGSASASSSDPLCDLYTRGFSSALGHVMDQRSDLRQPPVFRDSPDPEPNSSCAYSAYGGGQVDFYEDDDDDAGADAGTDGGADAGTGTDAKGRGAHVDDSVSADSEELERPKQKSKEKYVDPSIRHPPHRTDQASFAMDMGMYVVSGIILIFLMEQFIQIGVRLR